MIHPVHSNPTNPLGLKSFAALLVSFDNMTKMLCYLFWSFLAFHDFSWSFMNCSFDCNLATPVTPSSWSYILSLWSDPTCICFLTRTAMCTFLHEVVSDRMLNIALSVVHFVIKRRLSSFEIFSIKCYRAKCWSLIKQSTCQSSLLCLETWRSLYLTNRSHYIWQADWFRAIWSIFWTVCPCLSNMAMTRLNCSLFHLKTSSRYKHIFEVKLSYFMHFCMNLSLCLLYSVHNGLSQLNWKQKPSV